MKYIWRLRERFERYLERQWFKSFEFARLRYPEWVVLEKTEWELLKKLIDETTDHLNERLEELEPKISSAEERVEKRIDGAIRDVERRWQNELAKTTWNYVQEQERDTTKIIRSSIEELGEKYVTLRKRVDVISANLKPMTVTLSPGLGIDHVE